MKSAAVISAMGAVFFVLVLSAHTADTNSTPAKMVPARSMLTMGGIVTAPERKASPIFAGKELPTPPRQRASWSPPKSDLPTNYVSATRLLFEQGMADPRGCDYREIEVGTGEVWSGDGGVVKTHGWVLPGGAPQKFAVCWNGMVYPTVSVGTNADLEADVMMLATNSFVSWRSALPEAVTVMPNALQGVKGCLLLRLGKVDLATAYWLAEARHGADFRNEMMRRFSRTNDVASTNEIKLPEADPYLDWASDWAWMMFDRMICAHERGDEKLALFTARQLAAAQPQIEAECAKRGFKGQPYGDLRHRGQDHPYLNFLDQLPQILADLERRDKEGPRVPVTSTGITNITDQSKRIAALIRDLDLAQAHQWSQPGGVNLTEAAVVSALIGEGDAAVEPLLDCVEHDQRLTRSVGFGRDFHRGRTVLAVNRAADMVLKSILQAGFSNPSEMRAYWNKYKNLKIEERWYAILNDDSVRNRWQEAAANIVQPENVTRFPDGFSTEKRVPTNAPIRLRGEVLRAKSSPSVTELLMRHALEVPTNNIGSYDLSSCCQFVLYLARWDPQAALSVAKTLSKRAGTVTKYSGQQLGNYITQLSLVRADAADPQAFDDYAGWIVNTTPEQLDFSRPDCLEPLRRFPTNQVLQSAAEKIFAQTNSAWSRLPWKDHRGGGSVDSGLVAVPAYRVMLCRELEGTNYCGNISWTGNHNYLNYNLTNSQSGGFQFEIPEELQPTNGTTAQIRWCDWIAISLANGKHTPPFNPFAPVEKRNEAIANAEELLKRP
jgi:hypothetical protein